MKKNRSIYLSALPFGMAVLFSCAKEVPQGPRPAGVSEGYARVGIVLRVEQPVSPETAASPVAEAETAGLSAVMSQGAWGTSVPTREGEFLNEAIIHDMWILQVDRYFEKRILHKVYLSDIPAPEQTGDGVDYYHMEFDLLYAPDGCMIFFFANTNDPELFARAESYPYAPWDLVYTYDYRLMFDNEGDVVAGNDIPMYGQAENFYSRSYFIVVPFSVPQTYEPWSDLYFPQEWMGHPVAQMSYIYSKISLTVEWEPVIETVFGEKDFVLNSIQLQSVPRVAMTTTDIYPTYYPDPSDGSLFMDYEPIVAPINGATYTWYMPPNWQGYASVKYASGSSMPEPWSGLDPSFVATGTSRATRVVMRGTCGGEEAVFTLYIASKGSSTGYYNSVLTGSYQFSLSPGAAYDYTVKINGIDPMDKRVEYIDPEPPVPVPPDPEYFGTWMYRQSYGTVTYPAIDWETVAIDEENIVYLTYNGISYTLDVQQWTPVENRGIYADADNFHGYKMEGTLAATNNFNEGYYTDYMRTPDDDAYARLGGAAADYWYIDESNHTELRHGAYYWPHGSLRTFHKQAEPEDYHGTWAYQNNTVTITADRLEFRNTSNGNYFIIEDLEWARVINGVENMESSFYDFGYKLSGRLAEVQGFILALADDSGTTVTLDSEVADWWYIRDDKGALFRGTTASPHGVTQTTTLGYIRQ